jgi:hypothetical protein
MKIIADVVNQTTTEEMLEDGTPIGAAHTPTAKREGVTLTDFDQRRLMGRVTILKSEPAPEDETEAVDTEQSAQESPTASPTGDQHAAPSPEPAGEAQPIVKAPDTITSATDDEIKAVGAEKTTAASRRDQKLK